MYLFPFESIEKNSNIVIYGMGKVGQDYLAQLEKTKYCKVLFAIDKKYHDYYDYPIIVQPIDYLKKNHQFDTIIIALDSEDIAKEIEKSLIDIGITKDKIIYVANRQVKIANTNKLMNKRNDESTLYIGVSEGGGLGDSILASILIKEVRKEIREPVEIDFYTKYYDLFKEYSYIDHAYKHHGHEQLTEKYISQYDVYLRIHNFVIVTINNDDKVMKVSKKFYEYCKGCVYTYERIFGKTLNNNLFTQYALINRKNRIEQMNINSILELDRNTTVYMPIQTKDWDILYDYNLVDGDYITINRAVGSLENNTNPKLWPKPYYEKLIHLIKRHYPNLKIVQIGSGSNFGRFRNVDIDFVDKIDLHQTKALLKNSLLHIDSEGGLVHMNHFLNGVSVVLFGPTSINVFGYDKNINIKGDGCQYNCEWVTQNWYKKCIKGDEIPSCMKSILPDMVFCKIDEYLKVTKRVPCNIEEVYDYEKYNFFLEEFISSKVSKNGKVCFSGISEDIHIKLIDKMSQDIYIYGDTIYYNKPSKKNLKYEYGNIYNIPAKDENFDASICRFQNHQNMFFVIRELMRITKRDGYIFFIADYTEKLLHCLMKLQITNELLMDSEEHGVSILVIKRGS